MKRVLTVPIALLSWLAAFPVSAIEPEPNWTNRYRDVRQEAFGSFKSLAVGQTITIVRRIGGELTGRIDALSSNTVRIVGRTYEARQLTDETCDKLFPEMHASRVARERVLSERQTYIERRTEEERKAAAEALRLARAQEQERIEDARRAAASSVKVAPAKTQLPVGTTSRRGAPTGAAPPMSPGSTPVAEDNSLTWVVIAVVLVAVLIVVVASVSAAQRRARKEAMISQADAFLAGVRQRKALTPISTQLLLKKGEDAYLEAVCSLNETRAVRQYQSGGVGFRIAKGVYVGGGRGRSVSVPEMTRIDSGRLVLTNRRLIFDGSVNDRTVPLDKIVSVNNFIDAVEISVENRQKSMYFTVPNPLIWATAIRILSSVPDPKDLSDVNIDIQFR
jgi:type II secretory pathway pseudopilin PulG